MAAHRQDEWKGKLLHVRGIELLDLREHCARDRIEPGAPLLNGRCRGQPGTIGATRCKLRMRTDERQLLLGARSLNRRAHCL